MTVIYDRESSLNFWPSWKKVYLKFMKHWKKVSVRRQCLVHVFFQTKEFLNRRENVKDELRMEDQWRWGQLKSSAELKNWFEVIGIQELETFQHDWASLAEQLEKFWWKIWAWWKCVPKWSENLMTVQKLRRKFVCANLLEALSAEPDFLDTVVAEGESRSLRIF